MTNWEKAGGQGGANQLAVSVGLDTFIHGKLIDLVVLDESSAESSRWYSWFNDEASTRWMQQHHFPNTKEAQIQFARRELKPNANKVQLGIEEKQSKGLIGLISLSEIDWISRRSELGILIGEAEFRRLDVWHEANQLMIKHAFNALNLHRISGGSISKAVADLYVRLLGFQHEGVFREYAFKNGKYLDCYAFSLLRTDQRRLD